MLSRLILFVLIFGVVASGFAQMDLSGSLFVDHRANAVGDIVTILVIEYSSASSSADSKSQKRTDHGYSVTGGQGTESYMPKYGIRGQGRAGYNNDAATSRSGAITGKVTATITEISPTGNLVIAGERVTKVNGEAEKMVISGTVRPQDVRADNTVFSFNVANANIAYSGKGIVDGGQKPGIIVRFVQWLF